MRYNVIAKVDQIVTKEVHLVVVADSEEEAQDRARIALSEYPQPVSESNILSMLTEKARYWIPRDIEFVSIKEDSA